MFRIYILLFITQKISEKNNYTDIICFKFEIILKDELSMLSSFDYNRYINYICLEGI